MLRGLNIVCAASPRWQPDGDVRALGRALADAGADVVIGTGPHHLQGVEMGGPGGRTPIIYSAGKFMDDFKVTVSLMVWGLQLSYVCTFIVHELPVMYAAFLLPKTPDEVQVVALH